ncbi:MAG TPA: apolipoprotein N-acyltransferase [Rhizomicrobium sp.]|nr:apolipoprotein N-acyltransferase [Rhizomicrobium sp.]
MVDGVVNRISHAMQQFCDGVRALSGWRRFVFAFVIGLLSALSFAPFGLFPFLLIAFGVLVLLIDGAVTHKRPVLSAGFAGWAFGFGHFLAGLYWVGYAFTVDASAHAWQIPFVAMLFPGGLALFPALACAVAARFWQTGWRRVLLFTVAYALAEWLRGHILTGFPWNLPAYGWAASLSVLQSASVIGAYGLSLLTILFGASLALGGDRNARPWVGPLAMALVFATLWGTGALRLATTPEGHVKGVQLRLVQPDVPQHEKFLPQYRARNWQQLISLSNEKNGPPPTHIIWPESAPPFLLARNGEALDNVSLLTANGRVLMTGAARVVRENDGTFHYFNAFYIFAHGGQLLATYDKFHLVPFGEYLPLASVFEALGISKLVDSPGSFTAGDGPHTYDVPGAPSVGPLICYEILFPGAIIGKHRPGWLVNVTDDSWFGPSTGPYQHLLTARVRAIEEGLPIARDANTGISAVIDGLGRVRASLGLGKTGVVDAKLPIALAPTFYALFGDLGFWLMLGACVSAVFIKRG